MYMYYKIVVLVGRSTSGRLRPVLPKGNPRYFRKYRGSRPRANRGFEKKPCKLADPACKTAERAGPAVSFLGRDFGYNLDLQLV